MNKSFLFGGKNRKEEEHRDDHGDFTGLHYSTLHDQNEDGAGEKVDPSTGKKIDNSTDFGLEGLTIIKPDEEEAEAEAEEEDDAAAEWLRKNDPKFK